MREASYMCVIRRNKSGRETVDAEKVQRVERLNTKLQVKVSLR